MNLRAYRTAVTYFMVAVGIMSVALVKEAGTPVLAFAVSGALGSYLLNRRRIHVLPSYLWNILAAVILALFALDYAFLSGTLIVSAARFSTVLLVLKLFDLRSRRDHLLLFTLVFFQMIAAAASTVSPLFFIVLSLFIMGSIWAMIIFNLERDWEAHNPSRPVLTRPVFGPSFALGTVILALASIVLTLSLFFIIPRLGAGFLNNDTADTVKVLGFSERVDLGIMGPVKKDPTVVMRVELPGRSRPPRPIYFRGMAYDYYDGRSWLRTSDTRKALPRGPEGEFRIRERGRSRLEQIILLEPLDTDLIFAASFGTSVAADFSYVLTDDSGSLYLPTTPYSRVEYRVYSDITPFEPVQKVDSRTLEKYLVPPPMKKNTEKRIRRLLVSIIKGRKTPLSRAAAIESYLRANYRYTLNPATNPSKSSLEDFLFYSKEGYCEHYATAMAVLLRMAGIPSRLVTGFVQGLWNDFGNYLLVRQQDAHSWVEAYIPGRGWMTFDPTPPEGTSPPETSALSMYLDSLKWRWTRHIVHYSFGDQKELALALDERTRRFLGSIKRSIKEAGRGDHKMADPLLLLLAALVLTTVLAKRMFSGRKNSLSKTSGFYLEMLHILEKRGLTRRDSETPMEFAGRTADPVVKKLTRIFQLERYGGARLGSEDLKRIKALLKELKETYKKGKGSGLARERAK